MRRANSYLLLKYLCGIYLCSMLISLSNLSILLQYGQFPIFSLFWRPFLLPYGKSQSNLRLLHFGYCSNKQIRTNWIFMPNRVGGGAKSPLMHIALLLTYTL